MRKLQQQTLDWMKGVQTGHPMDTLKQTYDWKIAHISCTQNAGLLHRRTDNDASNVWWLEWRSRLRRFTHRPSHNWCRLPTNQFIWTGDYSQVVLCIKQKKKQFLIIFNIHNTLWTWVVLLFTSRIAGFHWRIAGFHWVNCLSNTYAFKMAIIIHDLQFKLQPLLKPMQKMLFVST